MKTLKLLTILLTFLGLGQIKAQGCVAAGGAYLSNTPGVVTVLDSSSVASGPAATYSWITFYDANGNAVGTSNLQPSTDYTSFTFSLNGTYSYVLTVNDSLTNCMDTVMGVLHVNGLPGTNCNANFSTYNDSVGGIYFTAPNQNGTGYQYFWDFGDGNTSSLMNPYHLYNSTGTYTACLTVWNGTGCSDTVCSVVTSYIVNQGSCDASAMLVDSAGFLYGIPNVYGANFSYYWTFGDGTSSTQPYPWHQYNAPGTYTVCLTVVDSIQGCSDNQCYYFTVANQTTCNANFYLFQDSINQGVYYAWNMATGNNLTYFWDFGDGTTSNLTYPIHTYASPGNYMLCLTVTGSNGCTSTYCDTLMVVVKSNGTTLGVSAPGTFASIQDVSLVASMELYPNPTNGLVNLNIGVTNDATVSIYIHNYVGSMIYQQEVGLTIGETNVNLDVTDQPSGVFIISVVDQNTGFTKNLRLIKE
ncbi:MAG: PKD domain-containing protein [Flavobacteriales bacterium]|nr:PKD domain-containing protein [Flavobacteriales bacterium]